MELCSFWVISPADGQEGKPEPVKLTFFENGDIRLVSICEDPDFRGAYLLPCGSYNYKGDILEVSDENLGRIKPLVPQHDNGSAFLDDLVRSGLLSEREWNLFYANPPAWKPLRIVPVVFGDA